VYSESGRQKISHALLPMGLVGLWSEDDADLIEKAIADGCEQINFGGFNDQRNAIGY